MSDTCTPVIEPVLRLFPVRTDSLDPRVLTTDLYLKPTADAAPVLYRGVGIRFTDDDRRRLLDQSVEFVYVPVHQHAAYRRAMLDRLDRKFHDPDTSRAERMRIIRSACARMIEDVLIFPLQTEAVDAVGEIAQQFSRWSASDNAEFSYLLDMSEHDYYTVTHLINVGVGCGLLSQQLFPDNRSYQAALIQGGMLHDLGKRGVPEDILNKPGRLSAREWEYIRAHPIAGFEELRQNPTVSLPVLEMARDHHERLDGQGYPNGSSGGGISMPARICSVIDVFDAICSSRPYRRATPTMDTLHIMTEGRGTQFDAEVLEAWSHLVQQLVDRDPERTLSPVGTSSSAMGASLTDYLQNPPGRTGFLSNWLSDIISSKERRRHERFPCNKSIRVRFVRLGKPVEVRSDEWIGLQLGNISRSGLEIRTPWPLTINDILEVELSLRNATRRIRRLAYVVRVRVGEDRQWRAGVAFS
jgi:HD-GYP domain-containing protein (c-di-GMP phosphodiesterase class II)